MRQLVRLPVIVGCVLLTGCAMTPQERAQQQAAIAAQDDAQCRQTGAKPGSKAYAACRTDLANRRQMAPVAADIGQRDFQNTMMLNMLPGHMGPGW